MSAPEGTSPPAAPAPAPEATEPAAAPAPDAAAAAAATPAPTTTTPASSAPKEAQPQQQQSQPQQHQHQPRRRTHGDKDLRNVIVNHLDESITEQQFREMFAKFGTVETTNLIATKKPGKGATKYGFIVFKETEAVIKAIRELNGKKFGKRQHAVRVAYASAPGQGKGLEGKCENVYISGFTNLLSKEEIRAMYSEYGQVQDVKVMDPKAKNFSRGVAFVKYLSSAEAESAIVNTNKKRITAKGQQFELTVKYGKSDANKQTAAQMQAQGQAANMMGAMGLMQGNLLGGMDMSLMPMLTQMQLQHQNALEIEQYIRNHEAVGNGEENRMVIVENLPAQLPAQTTQQLLWQLFGSVPVTDMHVPTLGLVCKGYAIVHFMEETNAAMMASMTNNSNFGGSMLKVYLARQKPLQMRDLEVQMLSNNSTGLAGQ